MKLSIKSGVLTFAAALLLVVINIAGFKLVPVFFKLEEKSVMGGGLEIDVYDELDDNKNGYIKPDDNYIERFLRPSSSKPMDKKYPFDMNKEGKELLPFQKPYEVIRAYFDTISDASNLGMKKGGCGSIGFEKRPYAEAYKLMSGNFKKEMPYEKFLKSFEGIGHINLLKLADMPAVKINNEVCPKYFVEIETIEGSEIAGKTSFSYYYGYVTTVQEEGWKIDTIEIRPEDFLCHAYHGWWHDAGTLVDALYIKKYGVIEKVLGVEEDDPYRNVIAKGKAGKQYRFQFIRLTNGADIELRQYVFADGKWVDTKIDVPKQNQ